MSARTTSPSGSASFSGQRNVDQAVAVLHRAIDLLEMCRGGGGLNVASAAVRELRPWRHEPFAQDLNERLLALMA